jgi:hypothetical protein
MEEIRNPEKRHTYTGRPASKAPPQRRRLTPRDIWTVASFLIAAAMTVVILVAVYPRHDASTPATSDGFQLSYDWCQSHGGLVKVIRTDHKVSGKCLDGTASPWFTY